jgi:hypothetical protein
MIRLEAAGCHGALGFVRPVVLGAEVVEEQNGSASAIDSSPGNGRRMLNPAPSVARCAVTTLATGRVLEVAGSDRGMRGRTSVSSTVMAGMAINLREHRNFDDVSTIVVVR